MSVLYVLIPLSLLMGGVAIYAFSWGVQDGQFDSKEEECMKVLDLGDNANG